MNQIAENINASPTTVAKYIQILEALYIVFKVKPYSKNIARAITKEPKIYFYDSGLVVGDDGAIFENMMAVSLLKHVHALYDCEGQEYALNFLKTKEGKEVDFSIAKDGEIDTLVEAKFADSNISKNLIYFCEKYDLRGVQVVKKTRSERKC